MQKYSFVFNLRKFPFLSFLINISRKRRKRLAACILISSFSDSFTHHDSIQCNLWVGSPLSSLSPCEVGVHPALRGDHSPVSGGDGCWHFLAGLSSLPCLVLDAEALGCFSQRSCPRMHVTILGLSPLLGGMLIFFMLFLSAGSFFSIPCRGRSAGGIFCSV